ncbi:MAG: NYN domain-containing protein [Chloroflexi bacterium]|nr:NYN domain-containing protein [Chloroflexota bacterium]
MSINQRSKTAVYVDGFNPYYGAVKGTHYKWLNIRRMCQNMLSDCDLVPIRYFTARVKAAGGNRKAPQRQQAYLRALATLPLVTIHYGQFLTSVRSIKVVHPVTSPPTFATVVKTEEKGSDVNLASMLLLDCFNGLWDQAVVVSADSDLMLPISLVQKEFGKPVGVLFPTRRGGAVLRKTAAFTRRISENVLKVSQLPESITDKSGTITKPSDW